MANPVGRPRSDVETKVIAVRIRRDLAERLDRYVDLATSQGRGTKASINSVVSYAIEYFLDAQEKPQGSTQQEPQRPFTPVRATSAGLQQKFDNMNSGRKKIIALLRDYPEGLSPAQTRTALKADRDLGNIMKNMQRENLLSRISPGRYVVADDILVFLEEMENE